MKDIYIENLKIGKIAKRALANKQIYTLHDITQYSYKELLSIHGIWPKVLLIIIQELEYQQLSMKNDKVI